MARLPERLAAAAARTPLYGPHLTKDGGHTPGQLPPTDLRALLDWGQERADPFAGRRDPRSPAICQLQVSDGLPLYLALTPSDVAAAARALASCWRLYGISQGDHVLIYDYGTSPLTLFASWCYVPGLRQGAADLLGAVPVCNDGLPEFAPRALHVLRYLRPRVVFIEAEVMPVVVRRAVEEQFPVSTYTELVVVSSDEEVASAERTASWSNTLGVPVRSLLRSGAALFFAGQCECGVFHVDPKFYRIEVVSEGDRQPMTRGEGLLCVTNLFLRGTPAIRYITDLPVLVEEGRCQCGAPGPIVRSVA